jgi:hypothetical protein
MAENRLIHYESETKQKSMYLRKRILYRPKYSELGSLMLLSAFVGIKAASSH